MLGQIMRIKERPKRNHVSNIFFYFNLEAKKRIATNGSLEKICTFVPSTGFK